ncbi:TsoY family (seleno)protein [Pelagibacterium limicola]|uniref:TsoY family (seleno)protein n=1 Tax=Pelagibacterium limicola TaxID=2791022 RepID=UPI0018AFCA18|nr:hypothetical protein [Pelagibacterium limicola]
MIPRMPDALGERYSPLYFLAALGAGGLSVSFFLYLMFWVPHPGQAVPIFEDILSAFQTGGVLDRTMIAVAWIGVALFAALHYRLLAWNFAQLSHFRKTAAYTQLRNSNAETQLLAAPLALAMAMNAAFVLGLVFVPGLWSVVEYLFPVAILVFAAIGVYAFKLLGDFFGRVLVSGGFNPEKNNSLSQLMPSFALAMIGVGLAAPAAMSGVLATAGIAYILSIIFITAAVLLGAIQIVLGFKAMLENGVDLQAAPTLWVAIPIVTVISIAVLRLGHGAHEHFDPTASTSQFTFLTVMLAIQIAVGLLGCVVLGKLGYFGKFVTGVDKSAGTYALVCPPVAMNVMLQFYINRGLVPAGILEKGSATYIALSALALAFQLAAVWLVFRLNAKHFPRGANPKAVPAE